MAQASRSIVINVTPEQLFEVITDFERYPEFLPELRRIVVKPVADKVKEVTYHVHIIRDVEYTLRMTEEPSCRVTWFLVKGQFMKVNSGSWDLRPEGEGKVHATHSTELKFGLLVPKSITKKLVEVNLPRMLQQFKERAESLFS